MKKLAITILCMSILLLQTRIYAQPEEVSNTVLSASSILESMTSASQKRTEERVKTTIKAEGYDYALTIQSYKDNMAACEKQDYFKAITSICTLVAHCPEANLSELALYKLKFEPQTIVEPVPIPVPRYVLRGDYYVIQGKEYIVEKTIIPTYKEISPGLYQKDGGNVEVIPSYEEILYAEVIINTATLEDMFTQYGLEYTQEIEEEREYREKTLRESVSFSDNELTQLITIELPDDIDEKISAGAKEQLQEAILVSDESTKTLIQTAASLIGKVPYQWGGKSEKEGYDDSWWTFNEDGKQKGLDCSGYVQWCYRTAGYDTPVWSNLLSTKSTIDYATEVSREDLQIGDLGLLSNQPISNNHVGIYIGNGYYIHCSSAAQTVTVDNFEFHYFFRVDAKTDKIFEEADPDNEKTENEDAYILAQAIKKYCDNKGLNTWIGFCEVVKNRINNGNYAKSVEAVLFEPSFLPDVEKLYEVTPTSEQIKVATMVLNGKLAYLKNPRVLYLENESISINAQKKSKLIPYQTIESTTFFYE